MKNILSTEEIDKYSDITDFVITYTRENIAYAKFFIKEPFYTKSLRDVPITIMAFIGNTGGLVSLCLGLSLISIVEIIHHIYSSLFATILWFSRRNQAVQSRSSSNVLVHENEKHSLNDFPV